MITVKLLWGMTWRSGAFGLIAGSLLGSAYGALFANAIFLFTLAQSPIESLTGYVGAGIAAMVALALIGMVMGALFGVPVGALVGSMNGLLIGFLTRVYYFPLRDARVYQRVIAIASAAFTAIAAWLGFFAIIMFYANRDKANVGTLALVITLPALIAGAVAAFISRLIANWYEHEWAKGIAQNVTAD